VLKKLVRVHHLIDGTKTWVHITILTTSFQSYLLPRLATRTFWRRLKSTFTFSQIMYNQVKCSATCMVCNTLTLLQGVESMAPKYVGGLKCSCAAIKLTIYLHYDDCKTKVNGIFLKTGGLVLLLNYANIRVSLSGVVAATVHITQCEARLFNTWWLQWQSISSSHQTKLLKTQLCCL